MLLKTLASSLIALRSARSQPYHKADEPKEINTDKFLTESLKPLEELQGNKSLSRNQATANHRRAFPVTSRDTSAAWRFPSTTRKHQISCQTQLERASKTNIYCCWKLVNWSVFSQDSEVSACDLLQLKLQVNKRVLALNFIQTDLYMCAYVYMCFSMFSPCIVD